MATIGSETTERYVFVLDSDKTMFSESERTMKIEDSNGDFILYAFYTEAELLLAWARFIHKIDPDIFIGYNIFGFDWNYIHKRCLLMGLMKSFVIICHELIDLKGCSNLSNYAVMGMVII